jgi:hypothetical protein
MAVASVSIAVLLAVTAWALRRSRWRR